MKNRTLQEKMAEQEKAVELSKVVSAGWLADKTGIDMARIYRIRQGRAGKISWSEIESIRQAIKTLFPN